MGQKPHTRSDLGCWTCRVRKKKCDEAYPACDSCTSRNLVCYGYGAKPEWMDGGPQEKKVLEELKASVKQYLRQKKAQSFTLLPTPSRSDRLPIVVRSASLFNISDPNDSIEASSLEQKSPTNVGKPQDDSPRDSLVDFSLNRGHPSFVTKDDEDTQWSSALHQSTNQKEHEAALLMNYIDRVFRLQFVCYNPPLHEFGRGWLLAFLTRTKPLYHMAITLSAFHFMLEMGELNRRVRSQRTIKVVDNHYALALTRLQDQLSNLDQQTREEKIRQSSEILACIMKMINFELLKGSTEHWKMHLAAASTLLPLLIAEYDAQPWRHPSLTAQMAFPDIDVAQDKRIPNSIDELSRDFQIATFAWVDIIRCASTQAPLCLQSNFIRLLEAKDTRIRLEKIFGCENWALALIAKISELYQWKLAAQRAGCLSMSELLSRARNIQNQLEVGLARTPCPKAISSPDRPPSMLNNSSDTIVTTFTRVFASAALTYLHIVTFGARFDLREIRESVALCINSLSGLTDATLIRSVVWPFCVTACMASKDQEPFLLDLVEKGRIIGMPDSCQWKVMQVVRECWRMRDEGIRMEYSLPWCKAMTTLDFDILLI